MTYVGSYDEFWILYFDVECFLLVVMREIGSEKVQMLVYL